MSRIGRKLIVLDKASVEINGRQITVKGPQGQLQREIPALISIENNEGILQVTRANDSKQARALHGLVRSLVANMVEGGKTPVIPNQTLADMHDVDLQAVGLADYGKPGSYFERQLARWSSQYKASETGTIEAMDRLMAWLEQNLPADDGMVSLVHGDYRLDNVMIAKDSDKIIAVLDWELSTLGHPFSDLAYQCMQWRLPHQSGFRGLGGIDRAALGLPSESAYVAAYRRRRGIDGIGNWPFFLAFSFFRLAAICQGVYKRALDGNASNPEKARTYREAVQLLSRLAGDTIGAA